MTPTTPTLRQQVLAEFAAARSVQGALDVARESRLGERAEAQQVAKRQPSLGARRRLVA